MSNYQVVASTITEDQNSNEDDQNVMRDIHALAPLTYPPLGSSLSRVTSDHGTFRDDFSSANSTLVVAGSVIGSTRVDQNDNRVMVGEEYEVDNLRNDRSVSMLAGGNDREVVVPVRSVKKEEVESKITAWKNAKIAEIMNRFKCEDAIIKGWESEQVQKANLKMKQVERKLEEKKARAMEKMENEIAKAHHKAEERRATAESIRGRKMGRVLEVANLMKAVGRSPVKNFF